MDIKAKTEQEIKEEKFKCPIDSPQEPFNKYTERNTNIKKKNQNVKGSRKKKDSITINEKVKSEEQQDCVLDKVNIRVQPGI